MKSLAFDLSTRRGTMALADGSEILREENWPNDRRSVAPFFEALQRFVADFGAPAQVVVGLGPGSYTGTRIAISAALGLRAVTGAVVRGASSLLACADDENYIVIGDAKRASYFFAHIRRGKLIGEILLLSETEMSERLRSTDSAIYSADELPQFTGVTQRFPSAFLLLRAGAILFAAGEAIAPIYLREPHITLPRVR